jgi:predicted nucleic acid binding AN1-type Zn finger protein
MELPNVGKNCASQGCNALDYLPFTCHLCSSAYCAEHKAFDRHIATCPGKQGSDNQVIVCPVCQQPVPGVSTFAVKENAYKVNFLLNRHIVQGCPSESKKSKSAKECSLSNCRKTELIPFKCNECDGQFCSKHRLTMDHNCTKSKTRKSRLLV